MSGLNSRMDGFITLLLDMSGRARPSDIQGVAPAEAAELLAAYAHAHPERNLTFSGDTLTTAAVPGTDVREAAAESAAPAPVGMSAVEMPAAEIPAVGVSAAPSAVDATGVAPAHEAFLGAAPAQAGYSQPVATDPIPEFGPDYGVPQMPSSSGFYGVSDAAPPDYAVAGGRMTGNSPEDVAGPTTPSTTATLEYVMSAPPVTQVPLRASGWWWLAVFLFGAPGAFVAWLVNRDRVDGKKFLVAGIVLTVVAVCAVGLWLAFVGTMLGALQSAPPVTPVP